MSYVLLFGGFNIKHMTPLKIALLNILEASLQKQNLYNNLLAALCEGLFNFTGEGFTSAWAISNV